MDTKRTLTDKAKSLIDSNAAEALKLYRQAQETYSESFDAWDAFFTMKAARASETVDLRWLTEIASAYKEEKVANLYGWLIFDKCLKKKEREEIMQYDELISKLPLITAQKNSLEGTYPCPVTIAIFNLADAHAKNLFNARRINDLLSMLNPEFLSDKPRIMETGERGDIEIASDLEKYYALKTKALFKLSFYEECLQMCQTALQAITKFHHDNDLWFNMRIALCEDKLGNFEKSEALFKELLSTRAGSNKWFFYRDIAQLYFEEKDYEKAWKYAVDAAYYGNEPHFLIKLYLLQARILIKLERGEEGKVLATLIGAILNEHGWRNKLEYSKLFEYYDINLNDTPSLKKALIEAQRFWQKERYGALERMDGTIISIHPRGKKGRLKSTKGVVCDFHKKDLRKGRRNLTDLQNAKVSYYQIEGEDGKFHAEDINISGDVSDQKIHEAIGKTTEGVVKNIAEFGLFVKLRDLPDGLLHKNNMKGELKNSFKEAFTPGDTITVLIDKITDKGVQLKQAEENIIA